MDAELAKLEAEQEARLNTISDVTVEQVSPLIISSARPPDGAVSHRYLRLLKQARVLHSWKLMSDFGLALGSLAPS